jgi:tetratricopeptide (TPR) repeat protein
MSLYYLKRYQECIETFSILEQQDLGNESTYYFTALSYRNLNNSVRSVEYLQKAIDKAVSEHTGLYYQELAKGFESVKSYQQTINAYKKANDFKPRNVHNYSIARIYDAFLNDPASALKYYRLYVKNFKNEKSEKDLVAFSAGRIKFLSHQPMRIKKAS